jgi:hypothetical protein
MNENEIEVDIEEEHGDYADYDVNKLNNIKENIQNMSKFNQIEILRILSSHKEVTINENKYGIHINLTDLSTEILNELTIYINYVTTQEIELSQVEKQKENYKNIYFIKDNKDKSVNKYKHANATGK